MEKKKHPMSGTAVKIEEGPFKGQYFKVHDYMTNQYQGKDIEKIAVSQARLVTPVVGRGYPLDDKIVFGQLYPSMEFICVHDQELKIKKVVQPPLKEEEAADGVKETMTLVEGGKDDTGTTSEGDNSPASTGSPKSDGRTVSSAKLSVKDGGKSKSTGKKD